jgi:hypothetical protein
LIWSRWAVNWVAVPVVVALCVACAGSSASVGDKPAASRPARSHGSEPPPAPWQLAQCTPIEHFREQSARHITVGSRYRHYDSTPPTSGPHWQITADPGFYTVELPLEELVHNLEHGQIVVWYAPYIDRETQSALELLVAQNAGAVIAVPYSKVQPPYEFVLTAWGASQSCARVSKPVIDRFRRRFQGRGPEDVGVPTFRGDDQELHQVVDGGQQVVYRWPAGTSGLWLAGRAVGRWR